MTKESREGRTHSVQSSSSCSFASLPFISFSPAVFCYLDDQAMQVAVMLLHCCVFITEVVNFEGCKSKFH